MSALDDLRIGASWPLAGRLLAAREVVTHQWSEEGWDPFTELPISADPPQTYTRAVADNRGTVSGSAATGANHRVAYVRKDTIASDSEIVSTVLSPTGWTADRCQQGHLHRVREISSGVWEAIAVWTSVAFGGDYGYLHANALRFDGTQDGLVFANGHPETFGPPFGSGDQTYVDRRIWVTGRERFVFGVGINEYQALRPELVTLVPGDRVDITDMAAASFNQTNIAVNGWNPVTGILQVVDPSDVDAVAWAATKGGWIVPAGSATQKRWTPFVLATRVRGGTRDAVVVEGMRWRAGEAPPNWSDARVQRGTLTPSASVPRLPLGPGGSGLWSGHFLQGQSGAWGDMPLFSRLR